MTNIEIIRPSNKPRLPRLRSAVTNGTRAFVLGGGNENNPWFRRWRDLYELHVSDGPGADNASEAELSLCRRCATLEITLEQMEADMSEGKPSDAEQYARLASHLRRLLETLHAGLARRAHDDATLLETYLSKLRTAREAHGDFDEEDDSGELDTPVSEAPSEATP